MKILNVVVGVLLLGGLIGFGLSPKAPPLDQPWFQRVVVEESRPVLLKFGAEWCGPCRQMDQTLDDLNTASTGIKIVRISIDENPELAEHYGVRSIPHTFLMKDGYAIADFVGPRSEKDLERWLKRNL